MLLSVAEFISHQYDWFLVGIEIAGVWVWVEEHEMDARPLLSAILLAHHFSFGSDTSAVRL